MNANSSRARSGLVAGLVLALSTAQAAEHADPLRGRDVLDLDVLVRSVLERNDDLAAAQAALEAAEARPDQVGALPDPMVSLEVAPLSIGHDTAPFGTQVRVAQRIPFPGKRGLRSEAAAAEARAVALQLDEVRLMLRERAEELFAQWFSNARTREVNALHVKLLRELERAARGQYAAGTAPQQDALQAELMLAELEQEAVMLEAQQRQLTVRINALLHRPVSSQVPPPPQTLSMDLTLPEAQSEGRPALKALDARIDAAEAQVALAQKAWLPDFEVMGSYSSMWHDPAHRLMVGVGVEVPLQAARRRAEVAEAEAMRAAARSERSHLATELAAALEAARFDFEESRKVLALQRERVLPAARAALEATRSAYVTGRGDFQRVIEAERALRNAELRVHTKTAELHMKFAAWRRIAGVEVK